MNIYLDPITLLNQARQTIENIKYFIPFHNKFSQQSVEKIGKGMP